jgi:hypothetical protein
MTHQLASGLIVVATASFAYAAVNFVGARREFSVAKPLLLPAVMTVLAGAAIGASHWGWIGALATPVLALCYMANRLARGLDAT